MGLVISKRRRPDSPFASSQCHSVVLQPRLPVSPPLLSASTHTRSTLQGFRSRIAPQTAPSPPLSLPREPRKAARLHTAPLHRGAIGLSVSSPFELVGDTELEPKSGAPTDRAFLRASPLPPSLPLGLSRGGLEWGRVTVSRADFSLEPIEGRGCLFDPRGNSERRLLFNLKGEGRN